MTTGYKLMLLFFVLAYAAGIIFFPGISWVKFLGFLPLGAGIYSAVTDKENFDPEASHFWPVVFLGLTADLLPLIMFAAAQNVIK